VCLERIVSISVALVGNSRGSELTYKPIDIKAEYKHAQSTVL
jgi:hypothetical protein